MPSISLPDRPSTPGAEETSTLLIQRLQASAPGGSEHHRLSTALVQRYTPRLAGFLRKRVSNPADAEEILFSVLDKVIRSVGQYDRQKGRPFGWTCGIARRTIVDFFRRSANWPAVELIDYSKFDRPDAADELDTILVWDRWDTAQETVKAVTNPDHWACYDRVVNGNETDAAVGADLGLPPLTCARYRNRVRERVEAEFQRLKNEEEDRP
jgi:DNA-directed RNA polymerase specialized sigma24 family protein